MTSCGPHVTSYYTHMKILKTLYDYSATLFGAFIMPCEAHMNALQYRAKVLQIASHYKADPLKCMKNYENWAKIAQNHMRIIPNHVGIAQKNM